MPYDELYSEYEALSAQVDKLTAERDKYKSALEDLEMIDRRIFLRMTNGRSAADLHLHRDRIISDAGLINFRPIRGEG